MRTHDTRTPNATDLRPVCVVRLCETHCRDSSRTSGTGVARRTSLHSAYLPATSMLQTNVYEQLCQTTDEESPNALCFCVRFQLIARELVFLPRASMDNRSGDTTGDPIANQPTQEVHAPNWDSRIPRPLRPRTRSNTGSLIPRSHSRNSQHLPAVPDTVEIPDNIQRSNPQRRPTVQTSYFQHDVPLTNRLSTVSTDWWRISASTSRHWRFSSLVLNC